MSRSISTTAYRSGLVELSTGAREERNERERERVIAFKLVCLALRAGIPALPPFPRLPSPR